MACKYCGQDAKGRVDRYGEEECVSCGVIWDAHEKALETPQKTLSLRDALVFYEVLGSSLSDGKTQWKPAQLVDTLSDAQLDQQVIVTDIGVSLNISGGIHKRLYRVLPKTTD